MRNLEKHLNALQAIIIGLVLSGVLFIQFFLQEEPCPLCLLQRLGMLGVATGALLNVRFGAHKAHYGLSLISCFFGGFVALRQIALHVCPGFPKFGVPFWGLSLYVWSFLIFVTSIAYIAVLLLAFDQTKDHSRSRLNWWDKLAFILIFVPAVINIFTTLGECGLGACSSL